MSYIVSGGHSPIAISISKKLSLKSKVFHLTRTIDKELIHQLQDRSGSIILEEWDLSKTEDCLFKLRNKLDEEPIDGIIFAHRYREESSDNLKQFIVEVETPFQLVKTYGSLNLPQVNVVFITSPADKHILSDQPFAYHANKAAITQLIRYSAVNYRGRSYRFNGVSPGGFIRKERSELFYKLNPNLVNSINNFIPLGRLGETSEIASVVDFLLSDGASYINGEIITIDGGYSVMEAAYKLQ